MNLIQLFLSLFFLFALFKVYARYRNGDITAGIAIGWALVWGFALTLAIAPNLSARIAEIVGIGRGADLVVYISVVLLFFLHFRMMAKQEKMNREITKVVREIALREGGVKNDKR